MKLVIKTILISIQILITTMHLLSLSPLSPLSPLTSLSSLFFIYTINKMYYYNHEQETIIFSSFGNDFASAGIV